MKMEFEYTPEESAAIGRKLYEGMRAEMEAKHWGRLVVIDIKSGDYEVGDYDGPRSDAEISVRLHRRRPDAYTWAQLVGGTEDDIAVRLSWRQTMELRAAEKRAAAQKERDND